MRRRLRGKENPVGSKRWGVALRVGIQGWYSRACDNIFGILCKAYSAASGSINILYVTGLAARAMVKSELKAA